MRCPFCRESWNLRESYVKDMMHLYCPSRAKLMENRCTNGKVVVAHIPGEIERHDLEHNDELKIIAL